MDLDPELAIIQGEAVARFLSDDVVGAVFRDLDSQYYEAWRSAATPEEREELWAKARAIVDLRYRLQAVADAGERAKHDLALANRPAPLA